MDLGIAGRRALVLGASKGLGRACATALAREGAAVTIAARGAESLERTAAEIRKATGADVTTVAADVTSEAGRVAVLAVLPDPDILVTNAGGPPAGDFRDWDRDQWLKALDANMLTPIAFIKATVDAMIARAFGRIVNITSASVLSPYAVLGLSNGARAGLTGFIGGLSRQVAQHNVTINNLLPGIHDTDRIRALGGDFARTDAIPAARLGDPDEFGQACAFLCGAGAGFIVGQNLLLDGGAFNSSF